jgi:hypothetical protein
LLGGHGPDSGSIVGDVIGPVIIGRDVVGGGAVESGSIIARRGVAEVVIGGSLMGGFDDSAGSISGANGKVKIGRDVEGGLGSFSGSIINSDHLTEVTIGGSLIGGYGAGSGEIYAGDLGRVLITGDLQGKSIDSGSLNFSGLIIGNHIESVTIDGSVLAGTDNSNDGSIIECSTIVAFTEIGSIQVNGNVIGTVGSAGDVTQVVFSAALSDSLPGNNLAIRKIAIGGRVERASFLGGYFVDVPENGNAQIGEVIVGGDWIASNLVAGIQDGGSAGFGDADDTIIIPPGDPAKSTARINRIVIGGIVRGTPGGTDHYVFESHMIGSFKANGVAIALPPSPGARTLATETGDDVTLRLI